MTSRTAVTTPAKRVHPARRWAQLMGGLVLYGIAVGLMISANVGLDPWTIFAQGWSRTVDMPIGMMTIIIGIFVLLLWIPLRQRPGVGTVLNVIVVGPGIDLTLLIVDTPESLVARWFVFFGGLALLALATGLYIGAGLGPGPRDGLMTGAHERFGWPIWAVRTGVELTVLATGWMLGGTVGLGTVAFALLIGPMVGVTLPRLRLPEAPRRQRGSVRSTDASHPVPGGTGGGA